MTKLLDRVKMSVSGTPGTGSITLGSAVSGYQTFAAAGAANGDSVAYAIEDGTNWEIGHGTYTSSGTSLARTTVTASSASGSKITATSAAVVYATALAADLASSGGGGFSAVSADKVQIVFPAGSSTYNHGLNEFVLLDSSGSAITWPGSTTVTGTNTVSGSPGNIIDGNSSTDWAGGAAGGGGNQYLQTIDTLEITLGSTVTGICGCRLTSRGGGAGAQTPAGMIVTFTKSGGPNRAFPLAGPDYTGGETRDTMFG